MSAQNATEIVRRLLVSECGFQDSFIQEDYRFGREKRIPLAAFLHRPFDARSVCVGATAKSDGNGVEEFRELGAPVIVVERNSEFEVWRVGAENDQKLRSNLSPNGLRDFFRENPTELQPRAIYEAKTFGRIEKQPHLFVEADLLPFVEARIGDHLTEAVVASVRELVSAFPEPDKDRQEWIFKAIFRLLAGKILSDKKVPGFLSLRLLQVEDVLRRVERHYDSRDPVEFDDPAPLRQAATHLQSLGDLRNLTTESLGDVYERALITTETRKHYGTHKTPSYLVDYVVWQLTNWVSEIPLDQLRVFEPGCGHAPFLVAMMRLVRTLNPGVDLRGMFRRSFFGIDKDHFAVELARLSLTVADEPNSNGWDGLTEANMFQGDLLERTARQTTVLLTNPPYESRQALEVLNRTIPFLPVGAVFGAIVPATLLFSEKRQFVEFRRWMIEHCQLGEVDLLPDGLFSFADHECGVLIGRRLPDSFDSGPVRTRLRRVRDRDEDRIAFKNDYEFSSSRFFCQSQFNDARRSCVWIPEFHQEIWSRLETLPKLRSIADVNQGLQHKGKKARGGASIVEDQPFNGSVDGFASSAGDWELHEHPAIKQINLDSTVIRRPGSGTDRVPQVLLNYHPVSRGLWRLKPFIDETGRAFLSTFLSIRPKKPNIPLEFLWALLVSPLANLYANTSFLKRNIIKGSMDQFPVPRIRRGEITRITRLVDQYFDLMARGKRGLWTEDGFTDSQVRAALLRLDAEVLRLYDLPAHCERFLLKQFRGEQRPGIPAPFTFYYPEGLEKDVPLYAVLSNAFQSWLKGESPNLSVAQMKQLAKLERKKDRGNKLSASEATELRTLRDEVDGRDYALLMASIETQSDSQNYTIESEIRVLQDRLASQAIKNEIIQENPS